MAVNIDIFDLLLTHEDKAQMLSLDTNTSVSFDVNSPDSVDMFVKFC